MELGYQVDLRAARQPSCLAGSPRDFLWRSTRTTTLPPPPSKIFRHLLPAPPPPPLHTPLQPWCDLILLCSTLFLLSTQSTNIAPSAFPLVRSSAFNMSTTARLKALINSNLITKVKRPQMTNVDKCSASPQHLSLLSHAVVTYCLLTALIRKDH